jgi:ATP-dependent HslUV protease ATP-binding subunit HslU
MEDIGARRLHTIMNSLLDEHLFNMPDSNMKSVTITRSKVNNKLDKIIKNEDLSKYIL